MMRRFDRFLTLAAGNALILLAFIVGWLGMSMDVSVKAADGSAVVNLSLMEARRSWLDASNTLLLAGILVLGFGQVVHRLEDLRTTPIRSAIIPQPEAPATRRSVSGAAWNDEIPPGWTPPAS